MALQDVDSIFRVGEVVRVDGRRVTVLVDDQKNGSNILFQGEAIRNVAAGGFVKIAKGFAQLVGKVDGESTSEDGETFFYGSRRAEIRRLITVSIVGYLDENGRFHRGVRELPLVRNECFLLGREEFQSVHDFVRPGDVPLEIGTLPNELDQPIHIGVNSMFASHIGIFGNTGSGKSYTLATLYKRLLERFSDSAKFQSKARIVLIDFNGEYVDSSEEGSSSNVITSNKHSIALTTRVAEPSERLPVPIEYVRNEEFWKILLDATEKTQAPFLKRALRANSRTQRMLSDPDFAKEEMAELLWQAVDAGRSSEDRADIRAFMEAFAEGLSEGSRMGFSGYADGLLDEFKYNGTTRSFYAPNNGTAKYPNEDEDFFRERINKINDLQIEFEGSSGVDSVRRQIVVAYYSDIFRGFANREHLGPLIARLARRSGDIAKLIDAREGEESSVLAELLSHPLTVVSLRDVNLDMKKVLPLLLARFLYESHKRSDDDDAYLNIVIDEAHTILSAASAREAETWKEYRLETFEEIIKEGRKFHVFLTIASQRPSDISDTIISQLHNYFLHRLVNDLDIRAMRSAVSYLDPVSFEQMPILATGTCIVSGMAAQVPVVVAIAKLDDQFEPANATPDLVALWQ